MYERFYRLRERPFALTPDPEYLYMSPGHRDALDHLRFGLESTAGFIAMTGDVGCGKTTLLQTLITSLDGRTIVARLVDTLLDPAELLEALLIDFGVDQIPRSKPAMLRELARVLVDQHALGRRIIVVIDEVQNLSRQALEEVRMLSNLETEKSKLMQIVLVGQAGFRDTLASRGVEQLRQRITVRYHLGPLDAEQTAGYVNHRLRHAALGQPLQFSRPVTDAIHARSGGVPRMINVICDSTLLVGYSEDQREIGLPLVRGVFEELERMQLLPTRRTRARARTWPPPPETALAAPLGIAEAERATQIEATPVTDPRAPDPDLPLVLDDSRTPAAVGSSSPDEPATLWSRTRRFLADARLAPRSGQG